VSSPDVFRRTRTVVPADIDALGHVNNAVWVDFIVQLSDAHSTSRGFPWHRVRELGGMWIVRRHEIDYYRSALAGDELVEETWVEQIKGARSIRLCRFTRPSDATLLLESTTHWAFVDPDTKRPRRIAKEILEAWRQGP
jgi:acyl-CoA thioester hydrolase